MKLLLIILLSVMTANLSAQSWRYRNNGFSKSDIERARIIEENNRRVTRQSSQRYVQQRGYNRQIPNQSRFGIQNNRLEYNDEHDKLMDSKESPKTNNTVSLVTNGTGYTIEEATRNALRSAIEQAFGTFVSANTEVLNDELIKDEIATVTSGNVSQYNVLSTTKNENGLYDVSLQAIVSIGNLTNYTKSKGFQVELAGAEFVMNMKMRELNKKNELAAIKNLEKKIISLSNNGGLFDYLLEMRKDDKPIIVGNSKYAIKIKLLFCENLNTKRFYEEIYKTMEALSLSRQEIEEYNKIGLNYYIYDRQMRQSKRGVYALRNHYQNLYERANSNSYSDISWLMPIMVDQALSFTIYDNLGNQFFCSSDTKYKTEKGLWFYTDNKRDKGKYVFYYLSPVERIDGIKRNVIKYEVGQGKKIVTGIPLLDYGTKDAWFSRLHFNPMEEDVEFENTDGLATKVRMERIRKKCYFQIELFLYYSEEELAKLKKIEVKYRKNSQESFVTSP